jgi:hypothetical protein
MDEPDKEKVSTSTFKEKDAAAIILLVYFYTK